MRSIRESLLTHFGVYLCRCTASSTSKLPHIWGVLIHNRRSQQAASRPRSAIFHKGQPAAWWHTSSVGITPAKWTEGVICIILPVYKKMRRNGELRKAKSPILKFGTELFFVAELNLRLLFIFAINKFTYTLYNLKKSNKRNLISSSELKMIIYVAIEDEVDASSQIMTILFFISSIK